MARGDYDIVIAGGGMVGVSLALCLQRQLPAAARILLVESVALPDPGVESAIAYTPSFDARSTALSYSSCLIYRELELWSALESRACPIESIHVSERGRFGSTLMRASEYGWPALGYVVENAWLGNGLLQALYRTPVEICSPGRVVEVDVAEGHSRLGLDDGTTVAARLLVVADGAHSTLRQTLGVDAVEENYRQHALIANVGHALPHAGCAFERFTEQGPLALLPLLPAGSAARSALVWSLPAEQAEAMSLCSEEEFLAELQTRFGYRLGRLRQVGERHSYPLSLVESREQVRSGVVIMGNAAHSLHPVAGQGFNLALRDVACLGAVLGEAIRGGKSPGELEVLQRYAQQQAGDQWRTTAFSDRLPGLFMHRDPALAILREFGLFALDLNPALKREFVRHTAGVAASKEYRDIRP
jgi:2-octaprenyl-6-methoxyphenol hydroxylase